MRKVSDFVFIDKYCIPLENIRWIEERDNNLEINLEYCAFPLIVENYNMKDLIRGFDVILKGDNKE